MTLNGQTSIIEVKPSLIELRRMLQTIMEAAGEYESERVFTKKRLASHICHLSFLVKKEVPYKGACFYKLKIYQAARESVSSWMGLPSWAPMYQDIGDLIEEVMRWGYVDLQRVEYLKLILGHLPVFLEEYWETTGHSQESDEMKKIRGLCIKLLSCESSPGIFIASMEEYCAGASV